MLSYEKMRELADQAHRDYDRLVSDGTCPPLWSAVFGHLVDTEARAAARAEVEPLVRLGVEIVQQLIACHDEPGCAANDVGRDFVRQAGAWLSPQVGDKGDG